MKKPNQTDAANAEQTNLEAGKATLPHIGEDVGQPALQPDPELLNIAASKLATDVHEAITTGMSHLAEKPTFSQRAKRIGRAVGKGAMYGAGAAVLGGLGYVAYRALKGSKVEAVASAVADAGAAAADAAAEAVTDAVAAALR